MLSIAEGSFGKLRIDGGEKGVQRQAQDRRRVVGRHRMDTDG